MNKRDKKPRRLIILRETLLRMDERKLSGAGLQAYNDPIGRSQGTLCTSPLCMETTCGCAETV